MLSQRTWKGGEFGDISKIIFSILYKKKKKMLVLISIASQAVPTTYIFMEKQENLSLNIMYHQIFLLNKSSAI